MTEADARDRLRLMVAADSEPTLNDEQVEDLLNLSRAIDSAGRAPSDDEWEPTWDLNFAAAEGWDRKAGIAAGRFSATVDGARFDRQQVFAQCTRMAERYRGRISGSIQTIPAGDITGDTVRVNG